ncbi:MAG: phospholipid-binding protein [Porticoccus sp.]|jgi:osmotically-inducible protein OsmY|nr:phospholipid-binding protein [Porticoccus sp.]MAD58564.1 phospholipid-binding protein [Porticoccus sp.]|tara:strand:- start:178 stop:750 length:573 start_codon:yes stop_codon:yes gene_type:complete
MPRRLISVIILYAFFLAGCTEIIHVATENPIQPQPEKISIGTDIDDWELETSIGVNLKKAGPELQDSNININSYNRIVLLTGQVPSAEARSLAAEVARKYRGVRQVYNEIKISGPTSLIARTNDAWLSAKLKTKLMASDEIESSTIKVITENGVIYLMGLISQENAKIVLQLASEISGAIRVVSVLEYTD